jgi:hypothetical protein
VVAQATPTVDDARGEDEPGPTHPYVEALTGLPGVEHIAVVDVSGRHVLGEWGGPPGSADALLDRAREAADPSRTGRRELEDVVTTTPSAIHLSRLVLAGPGHPQSVWVALRISRSQGSLPWSRAALAGLDGPMGSPLAPRIPTPREAPPASGEPAPTFVPPPPVPAPVLVAPTVGPVVPAAPKGRVALTARIATAPLPAVDPGADTAETTETAIALPDAPAVDGPGTTGPATAVTHELVRPVLAPAAPTSAAPTSAAPTSAAPTSAAPTSAAPASAGPTSGTSAPAAPAPTTPAPEPPPAPAPAPAVPVADPGRRSSFAPVMVVLPPPSPVPEDGRTEEPAPMPYPVIFAPDPTADEVDGDGSDDGSEPVDAPVSEDADPPEAAPAPATPDEDPAPAVDDEPRVARRLIHGFRRRA